MPEELSEKLPPQNIEAEKCLLGCLMIDPQAILKVADFLGSGDFYNQSHQKIYQAIIDLFEKKSSIDFLSVSNRLREKEELEEIGGAGFLTSLINSVPTASHLLSYAKIVQEKRILRDLIEASYEIGRLGYQESEDVDILLDQAEKKIFSIAQKSLTQTFTPVKETLEETFKRIDELSKRKGGLRGIPTGFRSLDNLLAGLQKSDLIILAARPSLGKSALATDIARNVACQYKIPVGIFSLEMSRDQIADRLIAAQADIDLWRLRTGRLSDEGEDNDFERIERAMGVLSEAPIFIDDASSSNILQMRAMARRLQADKGLGLLIIDYLQLMEPRNPNQAMVQQVTETSKSLKSLAKELAVPVLAISQLSRAVEQRSPQIPRLADLRESGCLTGDTLITRADTGERIPMKDLVGKINIPVFALGEDYKLHKKKMIKIFYSGKKMVYELKLRSGKKIKASVNHPFWRIDGWKRLDELKIGDFIATPKKLELSSPKNELSKDEIILLAHLLGEGCVLPRQPIHYTSADQENIKMVAKTAQKLFKIKPRIIRQKEGISWREFSTGIQTRYCGSVLFKTGIGVATLNRVANFLQSPEIFNSAKSEIFWDQIVSIKPLKVENVYDATVEDLHNFVANDIVLHNSLEQDADVVLFIYKEDKYKPNTEKKNIVDIIVAKHRNGPVGKVELYFDEQRVSFRDIEKGYANE
ncbi:MAG: replicative DNA helicase [Patescibacteria group bacterium]|nr:replicative DNA helicase [Patescibacteria group bacterium]